MTDFIHELELKKADPDDRILCSDCHFFKGKKYRGRCNAGEVYYVDLRHRCVQFVAQIQQSVKTTNFWEEGEKPFWE